MARLKEYLVGGLLIALLALGVLRGCDCSQDPMSGLPDWSCEEQGRRPLPDERACGSEDFLFVKGQCEPARCDYGETPPGCCPGMFCNQGGECMVPESRRTICTSDAECDEGQKCLVRPLVNAEAKTCGFPPVNEAGQCQENARPFNGRCLGGTQPPCGGACPTRTVCNIDTNQCEEPPTLRTTDHNCDLECEEAYILVYADPDSMLWSNCCAVSCKCVILPPLAPGRWGRYSAVALGTDNLFVSAYDTTYGDLVMGTHGRVSGQLEQLDYVDGVPDTGTLIADPSGPRDGRANPGPNVGAYTSIALWDGEPRITYYDIDQQLLKFAYYDAGSDQWTTSVIDDGRGDDSGSTPGDVGRYTSMIVDSAGLAHVTYLAHGITLGGELKTTPMYARSQTPRPTAFDDWDHVAIDPVGGCGNTCSETQVCVDEGGVPTCRTEQTSCAASCGCDEACLSPGPPATCRRRLPGAVTEPCGGNCPGGQACVAVPEAFDGADCLTERTGDCSPSCGTDELCVDDGSGTAVCRRATPYSSISGLPEGVGLFTSLAFYQNRPVLVYYDRVQKQLRGAVANFQVDAGAPTTFEQQVLPLGCAPGDDHGQFASMAVAPDGNSIGVAYQDAALGTLWLYSDDALDPASLFQNGTVELVDDGVRGSQVNQVGASASLAFGADTDEAVIAYADQTDNDLMVAIRRTGVWVIVDILQDGAYGSFARMTIQGRQAWITNYRRERDSQNQDASRLVVQTVNLDQL